MALQYNLKTLAYNLQLAHKLHWRVINEKLWAINIYNALQNRVIVLIHQKPTQSRHVNTKLHKEVY